MSDVLEYFGIITDVNGDLDVHSPIDGSKLGTLQTIVNSESLDLSATLSYDAFHKWRKMPAPLRGEFIRLLGEELRTHKAQLGELVTRECGKILTEGLGEVQEMIDICDFAVGLSRQLYGLTMGSERPGHKLMETWHPLGPVLVISAFNFPVAVWSWNFAIATVCGDSVIWKPSRQTPFTALACHRLVRNAAEKFNEAHPDTPYPLNAHQVIIPKSDSLVRPLLENAHIRMISATGSTAMGKHIAPIIASRLGRSLFELGGNNAMIVMPSADLDMALKAIVFSAVGTAGQRCTTLRRLFVHDHVYDELVSRIKKVYDTITVGDPMDENTLVGPLINQPAYDSMQKALAESEVIDGIVMGGERLFKDEHPNAYYVKPAIVEFKNQYELMREETFAPILYIVRINSLEDGIRLNNKVPQGLSSCIFSTDLRETELFLIETDTGIANVNIGPSGAEIGGAFGGEKETGGGREAGSDAWKAYMRRATNTINYSHEMPLAQGVKFEVD